MVVVPELSDRITRVTAPVQLVSCGLSATNWASFQFEIWPPHSRDALAVLRLTAVMFTPLHAEAGRLMPIATAPAATGKDIGPAPPPRSASCVSAASGKAAAVGLKGGVKAGVPL